jgi:hypothetical protein
LLELLELLELLVLLELLELLELTCLPHMYCARSLVVRCVLGGVLSGCCYTIL